jgi:hypothetical protein
LFSVVGQVLVKPNLLRDVNEEFQAFNMEEASVMRKIASNKSTGFFRKFFVGDICVNFFTTLMRQENFIKNISKFLFSLKPYKIYIKPYEM